MNGLFVNSGRTDWYTPSEIVEAARRVMGYISLDPASSAKANEIIRADRYYTIERNGLASTWFGRVWLNHPFSAKTNQAWMDKLKTELPFIDQVIGICYASVGTQWFNTLANITDIFWFPEKRIAYIDGETLDVGPSPQKGSVVYGIKVNQQLFIREFERMGGSFFTNSRS